MRRAGSYECIYIDNAICNISASKQSVMKRFTVSAYFLLVLILAAGGVAFAADVKVKPAISAGVEYSDNVEERKNGKDDVILTTTPSAEVTYEASRLELSAKGAMEFRQYAKGVKDSATLGSLDANMRLEALENFMFLDVSDVYEQVYSDAARGDLQAGDRDSDSVTDRNRFTFSPYVQTDLLKRTKLTSGYRFERLDYSEGDDKTIHTLYGNVDHELTDRWKAEARLSYAHHEPDSDATMNVYKLLLGSSYDYAEDSEIYLRAGPSYKEQGGSSSSSVDPSWEAGIKHALEKGMSLSFVTKRDLDEDPEAGSRERMSYTLGFDHQLERASWYANVGYNDYENSGSDKRTTVWTPAVGGTYKLTERLDLTGGVSTNLEDGLEGYTTRYYGNAGLRYQLSETFTGRFQYRYKLVDAAGIDDDYQVNRFGLYLDASF